MFTTTNACFRVYQNYTFRTGTVIFLPEDKKKPWIFPSKSYFNPFYQNIVKAMAFSVVMYGCESWTIKKAECWRIDAFFSLFVYLFILLSNIVLVLPYIDLNPPWVYMCSPSWTPLPPPSPSHPSGSSQCTSPKHLVSCIKPGLANHFTYDNLHVSMPFSHIIPPSPSLTESKRLFVLYSCVSFAVSHTGLYLPSF